MNNSGNQTHHQNRPQKANQNIQVYVRVRPLNARERMIRSQEVVEVIQPKEIIVRHMNDSRVTKKFTFDRAFGTQSRQSEVYHAVVSPLIEEVLAGYNCTVFAYGQTGTGKTHTMIGTECPELKSSWEDESMIGIIPRALCHLFDELRMMEVEFSVRVSYLELYNEELCDLLSNDDSSKIRIYDDGNKKGSVIIQGLEEIPVHSKDDVYKLLEKGKERRKTATTLMNAQSSRSHTVFSILIHIKENGIDNEEMLKIGKLNLVDLAGSENVSKAGNEKGIRTRETVNINQSLLTLGRVITALVERTPHIPYRESKLTRILQESLGGRTKTSIIATISPGHKDLEETLSTLEYAHRAKNIQNKPEINQKLTKKTVLEEMDRLKRDLMAARDKNGIYLAEETYNDMTYKLDSQNKELNEKVLQIKALKEDLLNKEKLFNEVSLHLVEKSDELMKKEKFLSQTKNDLDKTVKVLNTTKRRYKEKKVLLDSHVKTEKDLTEQATKLIEVADTATTDITKLHETLERRKEVDVKINTTCEQFVNKMKTTFNSMGNNLDKLQSEHNFLSKIIIDETENNTELQKDFSKNAVENIENISKLHENSLFDIFNCIENYSKILSEMSFDNKEIIQEMLKDLKQKENYIKNEFEKNHTNLINLINQQNSIFEKNFTNISDNLKSINDVINSHLNEINKCSLEFIEHTENEFCKEIEKIYLNIKNGNEISQKRQKILNNFIREMQQIENEENNERNEFIKIPDNLKLLKENVIKDKKSEINLCKEFTNVCLNDITKTSEILTLFKDENLSLQNAQKMEIDNEIKVITSFNAEQNEKFDKLMNITGEQNSKCIEIIEQQKLEVASKKDESIKSIDDNCKSSKEIIDKERNRTYHHKVENLALQTSLQNCINDYTTNYNEYMSRNVIELDNYYKSELKTYTPTGQTPSRKEFHYPRILAATSPHSRIIKRFRLEKDWSDLDTTATITEDTDTTIYEISSDDQMILGSINSTPIKSDNNEISSKLKDIQMNSNFKIPSIPPIKFDESIYSISQKNSPATLNGIKEVENKENIV